VTNRNYINGRNFEWKVRDHLAANGYDVVRAAGSKGGTKADLIAFKPGQLLIVQCKRNGTLPLSEWDRLVEVSGWVQGVPVLATIPAAGKGIEYVRLLGPKRPRSRTQPVETFHVDTMGDGDE
jgi:Holliday junction resolvase